MSNSHSPQSAAQRSPFVIDRLIQQRARIKELIHSSEDTMSRQWLNLFAPPPEHTGAEQWVARFERGYALVDGVMTGYKLLRRLRIAADWITKFKRGRGKHK